MTILRPLSPGNSMLRTPLKIEFDEQNGWVWFVDNAGEHSQDKHGFALPRGFGLADVRDAALATPWADEVAGALTLESAVTAKRLRDVVRQMLDYFDAPHAPREELIEVIAAVDEYFDVKDARVEFPLWAYALLDVQLRELIADDARHGTNIWNEPALLLDIEPHRDRLVQQLVERYARFDREAGPPSKLRMASSGKIRAPHRPSKTG